MLPSTYLNPCRKKNSLSTLIKITQNKTTLTICKVQDRVILNQKQNQTVLNQQNKFQSQRLSRFQMEKLIKPSQRLYPQKRA